MKEKLAVLLLIIKLAVAKWVLKNTEYCVAPTFGIETAEQEANELLRYAEVSGNLGYRTHARSRVRNSAQRTLDALRLTPKPRLRADGRLSKGKAQLTLTEDERAIADDFQKVGDDLWNAVAAHMPTKGGAA